MMQNGLSRQDIFTAFTQFDTSEDGTLQFSEFKTLINEKLMLRVPPTGFFQIWQALDLNRDGQ